MQRSKYAEVFYKEYCDVLTKNFRSYLEQELYIDVIFLCKCNKKVPAHQIVLGSFSSLLYELFKDHRQYFKGHMAYICVPDMKANSLQNILQFIYYGKVALKNKDELSHLLEDLILLDLPSNAVTSEMEPFCTYITGIKNLITATLPVKELKSNKTNHNLNSKLKVTFGCEPNFKSVNGTEAVTGDADGVSSQSSSLPIISSVITLVRNPISSVTNANHHEIVPPVLRAHPNVISKKQNANSEQQILVSSLEESSREKHPAQQPNNRDSDKINSNHSILHLSNEDDSNKKKNDLLAVLKKVKIACHNLESVGVSEDESTRTNLQSCIRIVKQCIVDINDMLSSEVTISSQGSYKFIDVEKDWELKVMLDNCLETLPRLEKAIENSHNKGKRHRRKERRESIDRLDHQQQKTICNEDSFNK